MSRPCSRLRNQRGIALLASLLALSLGLLLIAALLQQSEVRQARTGYALRQEQAWQLAHGMEDWARRTLDDARRHSASDTLDSPWLQPIPPIPLPVGSVSGRLIDRGGCLNVNALIAPGGGDDPLAAARLQRLLAAIDASPELLPILQDWVDADFSPRPGGAEDSMYRGLSPSRLAANAPMRDPGELRLLAGIDPRLASRLSTLLCALPLDHEINLNTASAALWMALDSQITAEMARQLSLDGHARYASISAVRAALDRLGLKNVNLKGCGVASRYLRAMIRVEADGTVYRFGALIDRDPTGTRVLERWQG